MLVNRGTRQGLRVRFVGANVEGVTFVDVHWYRTDGRMVLQDEADISEPGEQHPPHRYEEVATTYRNLVSNFAKARAFDLLEDCQCGVMEMKRLDPDCFLFAEWLRPYYARWWWAAAIGRHVSMAYLYRLASVGVDLRYKTPWRLTVPDAAVAGALRKEGKPEPVIPKISQETRPIKRR